MSKFIIGVDVGGTNLKFGLTDAAGTVTARSQFSTKNFIRDTGKSGGLICAVEAGIRDILSANHLKAKDISGVGLGLPGPVDPQTGVVKFLPNIPGWKNVPLKKILHQKLSLPVFIDNDVNVITLGEWRYGAGRGVRDLVCITLGTGVGGGLILDDRMYRGAGFAAGEIGHMPLNEQGPSCNCGGIACFERYVGNKYLQEQIARILGDPGLGLEDAYALACRKDPGALKFWHETGVHIGNALTAVVNLLNPTHIIIGGGVANNHRFLFPPIRSTIKRRAMKVQAAMVKIVRAQLGNDAGILGARVLVSEMTAKK